MNCGKGSGTISIQKGGVLPTEAELKNNNQYVMGVGFSEVGNSFQVILSSGGASCSSSDGDCHLVGPAGEVTFELELRFTPEKMPVTFNWNIAGASVEGDCKDCGDKSTCTVKLSSGAGNSLVVSVQ